LTHFKVCTSKRIDVMIQEYIRKRSYIRTSWYHVKTGSKRERAFCTFFPVGCKHGEGFVLLCWNEGSEYKHSPAFSDSCVHKNGCVTQNLYYTFVFTATDFL
jgi:hypothetical protein